ncbi:ParB/RepB/Spo0J family partition protein [Meiothermus granaticius]|uniref:Chromosome-partitioning protein Spo0J n=1 Tax=Meiothermus granaticius NBRC 107808 TaxID=1227551 RepID=A0A399FDC1_9DEIN|nr:ParB/RepB/Spo0J family partition protein [Meiothermus granaticius]MCL6527020.1 ParB/RepB/Spo0J family partition protein [Thermaceae bacterium]RIH92801.1 Chromosome-partitioning protein Spo0J [Meiothermus granaticius NBRC 107808]GEM87379.1 chromosome partitioning protein ParB [Meiothermus granaticius NBRC 107808]
MSKKPSGLGRGLEALLPKSPAGVSKLPLALIKPNPDQPRRRFDQAALDELTASIKEKGLLQPLLVRPKGDMYELIAGERRYRASQQAGLREVPVVIRDISEREALEIALIENLQREDLNPVEEAQGYKRLADMGMTQEEVAQAVGKARVTVSNAMRLLQLPPEAIKALEENRITAGHARALLMLPESKRAWGLGEVIRKNLSVRQTERLKEAHLTTPTAKRRSPEAYTEVATVLSRRLGARVRFTGERRGKLEIAYHSEEELNAILQALGYEG